jgi:hypothetical protein
MIVWAVTGLVVGWVLSRRLRVDSLGVFLVSSVALPLVAFAAVHRIDPDVIWGYAAFWLAVQGSYFLGNLVTERRKPVSVETEDDAGALENA